MTGDIQGAWWTRWTRVVRHGQCCSSASINNFSHESHISSMPSQIKTESQGVSIRVCLQSCIKPFHVTLLYIVADLSGVGTFTLVACVAGRRKGGKSKWAREGDPPASDLLALHALVFPLSFPFGRLPRKLSRWLPYLLTANKGKWSASPTTRQTILEWFE